MFLTFTEDFQGSWSNTCRVTLATANVSPTREVCLFFIWHCVHYTNLGWLICTVNKTCFTDVKTKSYRWYSFYLTATDILRCFYQHLSPFHTNAQHNWHARPRCLSNLLYNVKSLFENPHPPVKFQTCLGKPPKPITSTRLSPSKCPTFQIQLLAPIPPAKLSTACSWQHHVPLSHIGGPMVGGLGRNGLPAGDSRRRQAVAGRVDLFLASRARRSIARMVTFALVGGSRPARAVLRPLGRSARLSTAEQHT